MQYDKKYKYWFFYIKPEYLDLVYTEDDDSLLYAYTDNKEYAKIFQNQRDMNKFFMKKRKIDKDEVNHLAKYFMREYLIKKETKTKSRGIGSETLDYDMIITKTEDHIIQSSISQILMVDIWKYAMINPYIFDQEYLDMLDVIGFTERFNTMNNWKKNNNEINRIGNNIQPDYLSAFIHHYGFLLSSEKGNT